MSSVGVGRHFENLFERLTGRAGLTIIRIPDGCRVVGKNKLIRVETPFDYILLSSHNNVAFIDTKATDKKSFSLSENVFKRHQIRIMKEANELGIAAGFVLFFREKESLAYIEAIDVDRLKNEGKKSIRIEDCTLFLGKLNGELNWSLIFE